LSAAATLLITDGARPARALGPWGQVDSAPDARRRTVAIGAGDAFSAGVIAELCASGIADLDEAFWRRAVARGHAAAREVLVRRG
jgi:sugar/nucleoside kinase (ribokinase family)